jgi:hypothetical protein
LDRVEWNDRPPIAHTIQRTDGDTEDLILMLRRELKEQSDLGEFGAQAIHRALVARAHPVVPTVRTIERVLERRGALDGRRRIRRLPPPRGWYLPDVAQGQAELDSFDIVEGLLLPDGTDVEVLTGVSAHGGLVGAWPGLPWTARLIVTTLTVHWREVGLPIYAQFDNDNRFQGPHQHADALGRVVRLCLSLGIVPVFAPPREPGFQNAVENLNGQWQAKVWGRFEHESLVGVCAHSRRYVTARRHRAATRHEGTPGRTPFPTIWMLDLQAPPRGDSCSCAAPANTALWSSWVIRFRSTRCGAIDSFAVSSCSTRTVFDATAYAVHNPTTNRSSAKRRTRFRVGGSKSDREALSLS